MINVPHEPEMADEHQFRRLFTQSPACPHENTPIGGATARPKAQGSLDLDFVFNSGSPVAPPKKSASLQKLSTHIKQKISETRLSKSISRAEHPETKAKKDDKYIIDSVSNDEMINIGVGAKSTALSDLLRSQNGSKDGYDSDAQSIKTPQLKSAASTIRLTLNQGQTSVNDAEIRPEDSLSNYHASPKLVIAVPKTPPEREPKIRSSPFPESSGRISFGEALRLETGESPGATLKRLSTGIANGTIKPPTYDELETWKTLESQDARAAFNLHLQTPRRSCSVRKNPDTPQTVVKRLSHRIECEKRTSKLTDGVNSRSTSFLDELDPALVEYLSRFSPLKTKSESNCETTSPRAIIKDNNGLTIEPSQDIRDKEALRPTSLEQSLADVASVASHVPSNEQNSVHLFNMQISQRLASKSTATMLSPTSSENTSKRSLETRVRLPSAPDAPSAPMAYKHCHIRAEHNRRPSDPYTKYLFELPKSDQAPGWTKRSISVDRSKQKFGDDEDRSSCYTHDGGPSSSTGGTTIRDIHVPQGRNPNSIAIGGRVASSEIPVRRSSKAYSHVSQSQDIHPRRFSIPSEQRSDLLDRTSSKISKYSDGSCDASARGSWSGCSENQIQPFQSLNKTCPSTLRHIAQDVAQTPATTAPEEIAGAAWLTNGQRSSRNYEFLAAATPTNRKQSARSIVAPNEPSSPSPIDESATEMWNRAFQDVHKDHVGKVLLSAPIIEIDFLRRRSSSSTVPSRHQSSAARHTSVATVRRSHSARPHTRESIHKSSEMNEPDIKDRPMQRMSFSYLRSAWPQISSTSGQKKLQKRSLPHLSNKSSFLIPTTKSNDMSDRKSTPPLKDLIGIWGSFPSHDRAKRTGPAGGDDSILVRDFGVADSEFACDRPAYVPPKTNTVASKMYSTLGLVSRRPALLNQRKSKTLSLPIVRVHRQNKMLSFGKLRHLHRARSSDWNIHFTTRACENEFAGHQSFDYPELDLPQTCTAFNPELAQDNVGSQEKQCQTSDRSKNQAITPSKFIGDGINLRWKMQSDSSLSEPVLCRRVYDYNPECPTTLPRASACATSPQPISQSSNPEIRTTACRTSKDIRIPGCFEVD